MSTIDELMDRDPVGLTAKDYDAIIAIHRQHRAEMEAGIKTKKDRGPAMEMPSLSDLKVIKAKPVQEFKRRL